MSNQTDAPPYLETPSPGPIRRGRTNHRQRLILLGTGPFAVPSFVALCDAGHEVALVVTRPAPPVKSRRGPPPSPVREFAQHRGLAVFDPASINDTESIAELVKHSPTLLVVCDYGQILSSAALATAPLGGINLHGSLLPAYRGAAPVQWAVLSGDEVAGVSVIHMTPRLDGGPILATVTIPIDPADTAGTLEAKLSSLGVEPTLRSVEMLASWDGVSSIGTPQDASRVSRAPRLSKTMGMIDWTQTAKQIDCHVRGMQPWPGAATDILLGDGRSAQRIGIRAATIINNEAPAGVSPGELIDDKHLRIATGPIEQPGIVQVERLQPAGRNEVSGAEFMRGYRLAIGTQFGRGNELT